MVRYCEPGKQALQAGDNKGGGRVLELGCGAGANIPFFLALGMDYYAIEGSPTIVKQLHKRYADLADKI